MLGRSGDIYGYDRGGFDETLLIEAPKKPDGTRRGGLNPLWGIAPVWAVRLSAGLQTRDRQIADLCERLAKLEAVHEERLTLKKE